jgi:hypothetical protein
MNNFGDGIRKKKGRGELAFSSGHRLKKVKPRSSE